MTRQTTIIQNIHAPVYGHVAAGDIHVLGAAADEPTAPVDDPLPLDVVRARLRAVRGDLIREQVGCWLNWPTVLTVSWMLMAASIALRGLATFTQPDGGIGWWTFAALVLPAAGLVGWTLNVRRIRSYRVAQLADEVVALEREIALRRRR